MGNNPDALCLVAELTHQINSPLAAIRNALYLAASRSDDPVLLQYLKLADEEVAAVTDILRRTRALVENGCILQETAPSPDTAAHASRPSSRAAA